MRDKGEVIAAYPDAGRLLLRWLRDFHQQLAIVFTFEQLIDRLR